MVYQMAEQSNSEAPAVVEETLDILNEETDETSEPESSEADKGTGQELGEEGEGEESEEEKEEIKLVDTEEPIKAELVDQDLISPARRKEILKAFPDLFKKFPYLEKAYYRDRQFTEVFSDVESAKEAVGKAQSFDEMETYLMNGSTTEVLQAVKQHNPEAFNKIADNYLTSLLETDQGAYYNVISNVIKQTVVTMMNDGKNRNDAVLQEAARILNQFVFNTSQLQQPSKLSKQPTTESQQLQQERQAFVAERFQTTLGDLETKVGNILKATIGQNIDPKEAMSDYVRRNATRDAYTDLESLIDQDTVFRKNLDRLWEKAFESGFKKPQVDAIRSAYLSKAKTLLPRVIQKTRNEALRGMGKRVVSHAEEDETPIESAKLRKAAPPSNSGKPAKRGSIPQGMSNKDFIMSD